MDKNCEYCVEGQVNDPKWDKPKKDFPCSEVGQLLEQLNDIESLNNWEIDFTNSVTERYLDRGVGLTPIQIKKCEKIVEERG